MLPGCCAMTWGEFVLSWRLVSSGRAPHCLSHLTTTYSSRLLALHGAIDEQAEEVNGRQRRSTRSAIGKAVWG